MTLRKKLKQQKQDPVGYKERARNHVLLKYGITNHQFNYILALQGGGCRLCASDKRLCVDHNHRTGEIRGILCWACNAALGKFHDDAAMLHKAANYVEDCHGNI